MILISLMKIFLEELSLMFIFKRYNIDMFIQIVLTLLLIICMSAIDGVIIAIILSISGLI